MFKLLEVDILIGLAQERDVGKVGIKKLCLCVFSHVPLLATPWTAACQALWSMGFSRQEYGSDLPFPPPGHLSNPGIQTAFLAFPELSGGFFITAATWEVWDFKIKEMKESKLYEEAKGNQHTLGSENLKEQKVCSLSLRY